MMELLNALNKYENDGVSNAAFYKECVTDLVKLLAPLAPHMCEEFWEMLGYEYSVFNHGWCEFDEKALVKSEIELAVQINSKIRHRITVSADMNAKDIEELVRKDETVLGLLEGKPIKKVIVIPSRLVNIIA